MKRAKSIIAALALTPWLALFFGAVSFAQSRSQTASKPQMAEAAFKNIRALKGIPVDEFMGTMGLFSAALSVCCGDCHVGAGTDQPKWEDDTPPRKVIARRMVTMVNTINKENFAGRQVVTCWTCHRGTQSPAVTPTIDAIYSTPVFVPPDILPATPASAGTLPVDKVWEKYVQALGGAQNLAKLTSYFGKGTATLFDEVRSDPLEIYAKAPNQLSILVHRRGGEMARTYDGREAWVVLPLTVVQAYPLTASALEGAKLVAEMAFPGQINQLLHNWKASYPATIEDREVSVLQGSGSDGMLATFYFDKQTGLLTRMVHYANSAVGRVPTQIDYSDYRPVAGVMLPFKFIYGWLSNREEYTLSEVQPNVPIDAAKFTRPLPAGR